MRLLIAGWVMWMLIAAVVNEPDLATAKNARRSFILIVMLRSFRSYVYVLRITIFYL